MANIGEQEEEIEVVPHEEPAMVPKPENVPGKEVPQEQPEPSKEVPV